MKVTAVPAALLAFAIATLAAFGGGDMQGERCVAGATDAILATIRTVESGGNYQASAAGSSASGAYQFLDSTWNGYGGYRRAADAPPAVQDAKAAEHVAGILAINHDDVAAISVAWYIGHVPSSVSREWDTVPFPEAGNRLTPREYQQRWLATYTRLASTTTSTAAPPSSPDASIAADTTRSVAAPCSTEGAGAYALPIDRSMLDARPGDLLRPHHDYPAVDIPVPVGTPIQAMHAGTVTRVSTNPTTCYPDISTCTDICGLGVTIVDADRTEWIYCHARQLLVRAGDTVTAGQTLMLSGNTGHSSGPHLHLGIRIDGVDRCPQPLLQALYEHRPADQPASLPTVGCAYHA